jgi:hypothetical protein
MGRRLPLPHSLAAKKPREADETFEKNFFDENHGGVILFSAALLAATLFGYDPLI